MEITGEPQSVAADLQGANRFLEGLLVVLSDAHDLAYGPHLGAELVMHALEFLKRPAGELDHHVIPRGGVAIEGAVAPVRDLVKSHTGSQLRRDQCNGKAGRLGGQSRRAGDTGVHFDDHQAPIPRIDAELDIGAAGIDADLADDLDRGIAQDLVFLVGQGLGRSHGDRIAGVHPHRIEVLDAADDDAVVLAIADHLHLELFPSEQ